jgi:hypothetical protein
VGTSDRPLLLHTRSEYGYTDRTQAALPEEPEAVSREAQQARLTAKSRRVRDQQLRDAWSVAYDRIVDALRTFRDANPDRQTLGDVRAIEGTAERIDRRLATR